MNKWQPIETAPRDGTPILAWPIRAIHGVVPYVVVALDLENGGKVHETWIEAAGTEWATYYPTHWMPLPDAPNG